MLVKNTATGEKIDRDTAYIVKVGNKNQFFSSEEEYKEYLELKEIKKAISNEYVVLLSGLVSFRDHSMYTLTKRHVKLWSEKYDLKYLSYMFKKIRPILENIDSKMNFNSTDGKYLYLYKVVDNKLDLYYDKYLKAKDQKKRIEQNSTLKDANCFELASASRKVKFDSIESFLD